MPFVKNAFSDTSFSSPLLAPTTEISFYSPLREPFRWSHKKFNRHQQRATCSAPCQQVSRPLCAAEPVKTRGPSLILRPIEVSPGKEEKKKKRRESDAKWRSNLSSCFNHLKNKVLPPRSCQKSRVSKEVIVQKTVERVQYLESVVMLLNQAVHTDKNEKVSPRKGQQNLQMARKEFAYRYHFKNRQRSKGNEDRLLDTTLTSKHSKKISSKSKKVAVNTDPGASLVPAVVSTHQRRCDQLVPPSAKATASGMSSNKEDGQTVPSVTQVTTSGARCPVPTMSLICNEEDLLDKGNQTPLQSPVTPSKLTPRKINIPSYLGICSQSPQMLAPIKPYPSSPAWSPIIGAIWSLSQEDPISPFTRSFSSTLVGTPSKQYQIVGGTIKSLDQGEQGGWDSSSQDLDSSLDAGDGGGKITPDLICEEEIPSLQEEEKSKKSNLYLTPRSSRVVASASKPPCIPPKKRAANWSSRFINDVRLSQEGELLQSKSNRCKRLIFEDGDEDMDSMTREPQEKKPKLTTMRKKYHKRSTAARIRPWDPLAGKVLSPLYGVSRKFIQKSPKRSPSPPSRPSKPPRQTVKAPNQPSKTPNQPQSKMKPSNKPADQKLAAQNQGSFWASTTTPKEERVSLVLGGDKPNWAIRDKLRGVVKHDTQMRADPEEDFLDVESVNQVKQCRNNTSITRDAGKFQGALLTTDQDTESSQGSLLLQEIPHLSDDIITPLLLYGETNDCFLQDDDVEETLQQSQPTPVNLNLSKSDDEIVLTILELEEESNSGSSTSRSSPDCSGNDTIQVMEVMSPNSEVYQLQELLHQEAYLEGLQLSGDETGSPSRHTSVIISPVKVSSLSVYKSPEKAFLLSPVKSESDETFPKDDVCYKGSPDQDEGMITESFARFASSALRNRSVPISRFQQSENDGESTDQNSDGEKVYSKGATQALLNGQVVSKTKVHPMFNLARPQTTLICIDSGTPTKNPTTLQYSVPLAIEFVDRTPEESTGVYPTSDTVANASHLSSPLYMSPLSTVTPSTPSASLSLGHLSQSTLDASYSSEMPNDHYSLSQQNSSISSKDLEEWDFVDHHPIKLEAEEPLDGLMEDEFLGGYYNSYREVRDRGVDSYRDGAEGAGTMEVPIWIESTNVASQSSEVSSCCCIATNNSSDTMSTDSLQGEYQVVPSITCNEANTMEPVGMSGNQSQSGFDEAQYDAGGSPDKALQIFQQWLINN